jgi:hypothetical protein
VRYYKKMRPNRVYPVVVSWTRSGGDRGGAGGPVLLRLLMAGAQVVPQEQSLDPADPDAAATFYVTPIARGWLRGEHLEVIQGGRKVQEIKLPAKATTQRLTWFLFAMMFFFPLFVTPLFTNEGRVVEYVEKKVGPDEEPNRIALAPGKSLTAKVNRLLIEPPGWFKSMAPGLARSLQEVPVYIGDFYNFLYYKVYEFPLGFYAFCLFLVLTLLSWWWHLESRKRRVGRPLAVGRGDEEG